MYGNFQNDCLLVTIALLSHSACQSMTRWRSSLSYYFWLVITQKLFQPLLCQTKDILETKWPRLVYLNKSKNIICLKQLFFQSFKRNEAGNLFLNYQIDPRFKIPPNAQAKIIQWIKLKNTIPTAIQEMLGDISTTDLDLNDPKEFFMRF